MILLKILHNPVIDARYCCEKLVISNHTERETNNLSTQLMQRFVENASNVKKNMQSYQHRNFKAAYTRSFPCDMFM